MTADVMGRSSVVERRPAPRLTGRWKQNAPRRTLTDEDIRGIRWWAATEGRRLLVREQARRLQQWYPLSVNALTEMITGGTFQHVVGPPITTRYWKPKERIGLLMWLVWLIWYVRLSVRRS